MMDSLTPNNHLIFKDDFNQSVDNLPPNITHITFGHDFNQSVDNLPPNVTHLTFGDDFNQSVDNLPPNVTHLTFGYRFNQPVDKLPITVTISLLESVLIKVHVNSLPMSHLTFGEKSYKLGSLSTITSYLNLIT
jgi:hypothetical protein